MKSVMSLILVGTFVCLYGVAVNASEINGTEPFNLIEYCKENEIQSEEELQTVLETYVGESNIITGDELSDTEVSFELIIDEVNQLVITTTVYESDRLRGSVSGYTTQKYRNNLGILIFEVRVDASFSYNGSTCSTTSATATYTPAPLSSWSSSPSVTSGKSGSRAYGRAYGTAVNGSHSQYYSVYLYCDVNGNLSAT